MRISIHFVVTILGTVALTSAATEPIAVKKAYESFGEAHRFIFFAVLEGLYEDGVSRDDVALIMRREEGKGYEHFIYACPICTAVVQATAVYASRPEWRYKSFDDHRVLEANFGTGLPGATREGLSAKDVETRLETIFQLVSKWVNRRLERSNISETSRKSLLAEIDAGKELGTRRLQGYKKNPDKTFLESCAPGYANIDACAMCNAASNSEFKGLATMDLNIETATPLGKK